MKRNFNFKLKKKKKLIAQDMMHTCIYILLIVWLFVYIEFEIGCVLPREIQRIIGNECFFQLHLDEYNLKYERENYTVSKILETKILHKVEGHQVIIKLKSISSIFITPKYHRIHNYSLHGISSMLYILFMKLKQTHFTLLAIWFEH